MFTGIWKPWQRIWTLHPNFGATFSDLCQKLGKIVPKICVKCPNSLVFPSMLKNSSQNFETWSKSRILTECLLFIWRATLAIFQNIETFCNDWTSECSSNTALCCVRSAKSVTKVLIVVVFSGHELFFLNTVQY